MEKFKAPNVVKPGTPDLACFMCLESIKAAQLAGVLKNAFPAGIRASDKFHCKLLVDLRDVPLFIVTIKGGTNENVFRNIAAALYFVPAQKGGTR